MKTDVNYTFSKCILLYKSIIADYIGRVSHSGYFINTKKCSVCINKALNIY